MRFSPRFLGGVDISARAEGSAGISIEYEFYDVSKTYRAGPWVWVTLGTNLIAEASAEAQGTVETGVNVSMGTNVGINTGVAYDGSRDGPPSWVRGRSATASSGTRPCRTSCPQRCARPAGT